MVQTRRLEGFDGLRACAAILVIAYHAGNLTGATSAGALAPLVAELKAGVAIFFVISGFLLYLPHARANRGASPAPGWREFGWRRAARILPAYWVALTLLALVSQAPGVLGSNWWRFYALGQIYQHPTLDQGLGVAWSLSVEISFYLLLPLFALGMRHLLGSQPARSKARVELMVIAALGLGSIALRAMLARSLVLPVLGPGVSLATSIVGMADWFAAGLALAVLRAHWESGSALPRPLVSLARRPGLCWLLAVLLYLAGVPAQHGELSLAEYGVATHVAIGLAAGLFVLPAVVPAPRGSRSGPLRLLRTRTLAWLGTISYGIYLWHVGFRNTIYPLLGAPRGAAAFAGLFVLTLAGGVCLGAASWYLVERPAQRWVRARLARPRQPIAASALAVGPGSG